MNERPHSMQPPPTPPGHRIVLAGEPDFSIGALRVRPSRGEVEGPGGAFRLEPRVMQVLVALSARRGGTVSRKELIDQCWDGLTVGKDAVNRVISILRGVAERAQNAFSVETLNRIGYRLTPTSLAMPEALAPVIVTDAPDDPIVRDLHARSLIALEQPTREAVGQALAYLNEVIARAPDWPLGWAALAEAQRRNTHYFPPPLQEPERAKSETSARHALMLDPQLGQAYGTLAGLKPRFGAWGEVQRLLETGLALAPDRLELRQAWGQFLMASGRSREGLTELLSIRTLNPLSPSIAVEAASALLDCGRDDDALDAIDRAHALWPGIMLVWSERVRLHLVAGNYHVAERLLAAPPASVPPDDPNLARRRLHLTAKRDRSPQALSAATANFEAFAQIGGAPAVVAIHALTTLGQDARALEVADHIFRADPTWSMRSGVNMMGAYPMAGEPDTTVLFRRDTASMRKGPIFARILERIGLEDYWRATGTTPAYRQPS